MVIIKTKENTLIKEFNKEGKLVHTIMPNNSREIWIERDEKGRKIRYKDSKGRQELYEYNDKNEVIRVTDENGYLRKSHLRDNNGNIIYTKYRNVEVWHEYDENNRRIHSRDSKGNDSYYKYDDKGNMVYFEYPKRNITIEYKYNENNKLIYDKFSNKYETAETWYTYDENNKIVYQKDSNGKEIYYERIYQK